MAESDNVILSVLAVITSLSYFFQLALLELLQKRFLFGPIKLNYGNISQPLHRLDLDEFDHHLIEAEQRRKAYQARRAEGVDAIFSVHWGLGEPVCQICV